MGRAQADRKRQEEAGTSAGRACAANPVGWWGHGVHQNVFWAACRLLKQTSSMASRPANAGGRGARSFLGPPCGGPFSFCCLKLPHAKGRMDPSAKRRGAAAGAARGPQSRGELKRSRKLLWPAQCWARGGRSRRTGPHSFGVVRSKGPTGEGAKPHSAPRARPRGGWTSSIGGVFCGPVSGRVHDRLAGGGIDEGGPSVGRGRSSDRDGAQGAASHGNRHNCLPRAMFARAETVRAPL